MRKYLKYIVLVIFVLIIILPPLVRGYVYPSLGDDASYHMSTIDSMDIYNPTSDTLYLGEIIVGYPMALLKNWVSVNTMYLWFSYILLIVVGLIFYYVVSKLVNNMAGIFAILLPIFGVASILMQWYAGTVFNIINMGIMMLAVYYTIKWMEYKKIYNLIISILLFCLAFVFHVSGIYLVALIPSLVISYYMAKSSRYRFVITIFIFSIALVIAFISKISIDPTRQSLDFLTIVSILVALILGIIVTEIKIKYISIGVFILVIAIVANPLYQWIFNYNSAITKTDLQAIAYVNSLDGDYYSCSPQVAYWVYDRFINKEYKEGELPYIVRNEPMTNQTMDNSKDYWWKDKPIPNYDRELAKRFTDGGLIIDVVY